VRRVGDKFTISVSPGDLSSAETFLGELGRNIDEEGTKLANLPGKSASWTGKTATTLKGEMTRIAGQMKTASDHFNTAKTAVATFRGKVEEAQRTLVSLNSRWNDAQGAYDSAVGAANQQYSRDARPYNNMPPEDVGTARKDLQATRDRAVGDAAGVRDAAQAKLQGEYDELIRDLETAAGTCGSTMAAAVVVAVPAEVVSKYLAGGGMGPGALNANFDKETAAARQQLTGDESLAGQADDIRAGDELAKSVKDKIARGEKLTPEEIAALKAGRGNAAFVQGFMETMGPQGMAALSYTTIIGTQAPSKEERKAAEDLKGVLTDLFVTGSHVQVDDGKGGQRYLMDDGWLSNFNPRSALPEPQRDHFRPQDGYVPAVLLPFLTKPLSENFTKVVGNRFLQEYGDATKHGPGGFNHNRYRTMHGGYDLLNILFDRMDDHPGVSNELMTAHTRVFMDIATGKDKQLLGGVNDTDVRKHLTKIFENAILGVTDPQHVANADYIVASMGQYLAGDPTKPFPPGKEPKFIKEMLPTLGKVLTTDRYFYGQVYSVATPFAPGLNPTGFPNYTSDPNMGLLMSPKAWEQLQQEALRDPESAEAIASRTVQWLQAARKAAGGQAFVYDPNTIGPDGEPLVGPSGKPFSAVGDFEVVGLDLYQQEAVRRFLGQNLLAVKDELTAEMEKKIEKAGGTAATGVALVGSIFQWVQDPQSIPGDILAFSFDKTVGYVSDQYVKGERTDIKATYDQQLKALQNSVSGSFVDPKFWDQANTAADNLAGNYEERVTPPAVFTEGDQDKHGPAQEYTGDPKTYVGKKSQYVNGTVITDDFLEYGDNGEVTGVVNPAAMNSLQREAYLNWLKDPAVQKHLDQEVTAVGTAADRAAK
jgi:hypothetical protein